MRVRCTKCLKLKLRVWNGRVGGAKGRRRYFEDEKGSVWNGHKCPRCCAVGIAKYTKKTRHAEALLGPGKPEFELKRECRKCGGKTPNYYHCATCQVNRIEFRDMSEEYGFHLGGSYGR